MSDSPSHPPALQKRSQLSRGGRLAAGLGFTLIAGVVFFAEIEPHWIKWVLWIVTLAGLLVITFWRAPEEEKRSEDDLIEVARQAIRSEASRLDNKRADLEKVLMSYGEWMEFPDYQLLQTIDWADENHAVMDERVASLLDAEADLMLQRFSKGVYWTDGKFEGRQLLLDLVSFTEAIARIYRPDSDRPLLELNLESLLKALNRTSVQVILLLEELPIVEVKEMNLRKMSDNIRKASSVYKKYEELQPYLKPVRYLWQGSKMLLTANPILAAGWIAGSEIIWKGGKHLGKKAMDAYLLSLVRQTMGIIAWETAGIYDPTHRYRSPDWLYGVELAHLLSKFDATQEVLRETFRELGRLPLKSSYDRIFLYRCIAQNASPKPKHFAQPELLSREVREQLMKQLIEFYEKNISANAETENAETVKWRAGLTERLGLQSSRPKSSS
ncbi:MAG: hypothetical protein P1U68_15080 [Verrucomicrobiales bacterium]|nr:hypothetical protein [Verrucomicrobiales bacterium]